MLLTFFSYYKLAVPLYAYFRLIYFNLMDYIKIYKFKLFTAIQCVQSVLFIFYV